MDAQTQQTAELSTNRYRDVFVNYILGGVRESLERVRAYEYTVPDAVRVQAWHILSFALNVEEAWDATKDLLLELAPKR